MKILDDKQLLFLNDSAGKFVLYSNSSRVGEVMLPIAGVTYFPPEHIFIEGKSSLILKIRFDFLDGDGMEILRRVVRFYHDDQWRHELRLIIPGESEKGYNVIPYGNWKAWFIDDEPQGYGPVEAQFKSSDVSDIAEEEYSNSEPWMVD